MTKKSVKPTASSKPPRQRRPHARPTEILEAALTLFSERGFAATRMDDVGKRAGVSKGLVYLYFPDKEALLKAIVEEKTGVIIDNISNAVAVHQGPVGPLIAILLNGLAETLDKTRIAALVKLVISESRAHPEIGRAYLNVVIAKGFPVFENLILRGVITGEFRASEPGMTVRSLIAPMLLAAFWKSVFEPLGAAPLSARALAQHHTALILRALKP